MEELEVCKTTFSSSQEKLAHTAVPLYYSNAFLYRETFINFRAVVFFKSADFMWQTLHRLLCCYFWLFWTQLNPPFPPSSGFCMLPHKLPTLEIFSFTTHLVNWGQVGTRAFSVWFLHVQAESTFWRKNKGNTWSNIDIMKIRKPPELTISHSKWNRTIQLSCLEPEQHMTLKKP